MGRFSPSVLPTSGAVFGRALEGGVDSFLQARRQRRADDLQDTATQRATSIQNAQLGEQGIHLTKPGELPPQFDISVTGGPDPEEIANRAIAPRLTAPPGSVQEASDRASGVAGPQLAAALPGPMPGRAGALPARGAPQQPDPRAMAVALSRHLQIGDGYYIDQDERGQHDAARAEAATKAAQGKALAEALGKGQAEDALDPGGRALKHELTASEIARNKATATAPRAPLMGSAEWIAAQRAAAGIQQDTHESNRTFDVNHPMPQQDGGKMTEFSNKAALVYPRAQEAFATLDKFFTSGIPAKQGLGRLPGVGNLVLSPEEQVAQSAAETVSSAILRLESGAAISEHEVKEYAKQFLPQIGDSKEVLQDKRHRLQTQLERMRQAANPTMKRDTPGGTANAAPPAHIQTIDEMIRAGASDGEIKAALGRGVQ